MDFEAEARLVLYFIIFMAISLNHHVRAKEVPGKYIIEMDVSNGRRLEEVKANLKNKLGNIENMKIEPVLLKRLGFVLLDIGESNSTNLEALQNIEGLYQDQFVYSFETPKSWGLDRIDQQDLPLDRKDFTLSHYGKGVNVYLIDSGINIHHKEFNDRARYGIDLTGEGHDDSSGHGTHCAGIIGSTTYGIAKNASIVSIKVLDKNGEGTYGAVLQAIAWALGDSDSSGVLSISVGGTEFKPIDDAVLDASEAGMIVVIAAGNLATNACSLSPSRTGGNASNGSTICVGSSSEQDKRSEFSNYGSCVDVFAPGENIQSTGKGCYNCNSSMSGTSMAAPHVAGVAATLLEKHQGQKKAAQEELVSLFVSDKLRRVGKDGTPNKLLQAPPEIRCLELTMLECRKHMIECEWFPPIFEDGQQTGPGFCSHRRIASRCFEGTFWEAKNICKRLDKKLCSRYLIRRHHLDCGYYENVYMWTGTRCWRRKFRIYNKKWNSFRCTADPKQILPFACCG